MAMEMVMKLALREKIDFNLNIALMHLGER